MPALKSHEVILKDEVPIGKAIGYLVEKLGCQLSGYPVCLTADVGGTDTEVYRRREGEVYELYLLQGVDF